VTGRTWSTAGVPVAPRAGGAQRPRVFLQRVLSTYGLKLVIAALLLFGIDRLDLYGHPLVAIKRTVLVACPACFAATVVDNLGG